MSFSCKKTSEVDYMHTLFIFLFSNISLLCADSYIYRDINRPIIQTKPNCKIIQSGPYRTGSTLIYNILKYLFEDKTIENMGGQSSKVIKIHGLTKDAYIGLKERCLKPYIIITIRHPLNAAASLATLSKNKGIGLPDQLINEHINQYKSIYNDTQYLYDSNDFICLYYEEFENNFEYIFKQIETFFEIRIPEKEKLFIMQTFNKSSVEKHIKHLTNFSQWHAQTHFHGSHITNSDFTKIESKEIKEKLKRMYADSINIWGYEIINS
jgi:hypothetical protein